MKIVPFVAWSPPILGWQYRMVRETDFEDCSILDVEDPLQILVVHDRSLRCPQRWYVNISIGLSIPSLTPIEQSFFGSYETITQVIEKGVHKHLRLEALNMRHQLKNLKHLVPDPSKRASLEKAYKRAFQTL